MQASGSGGSSSSGTGSSNPAVAAARTHRGRIGAAPNGIGRTDGANIIWSSQVYDDAACTTGYTWLTFRGGWRDALDKVYQPDARNSCLWTCCGAKWDAPGCTAASGASASAAASASASAAVPANRALEIGDRVHVRAGVTPQYGALHAGFV